MKRWKTIISVGILGMMMTGLAMASDMPEFKADTYKLDNGLTVILYQDRSNPTVAVNFWYHVGSQNEKAGRTGFAHLFEHLMFNGSEHYPEDYFTPLQKVGATINGSTSEDRTNYFEVLPSNELELAFWMESDRMGYLLPGIDQQKLDIQRGVVKNERRQRLDNQPYAKGYEIGLEMMYPPSHPYHHSVIGKMDDLDVANLDDVKEFFRLYYAPNNASIAIVGDFDMDQAKSLVEKYFGSIPSSHSYERYVPTVPVLDRDYRSEVEDKVSLPQITLDWHTPGLFQPGDAEFDVLGSILSSGKTSRLYKALVYDRQIAQNVRAYQSSSKLSSLFEISVDGKPDSDIGEIENVVNEILADLLKNGITQEEVDRARVNFQTDYVRRLQSNNGRANNFNNYLFNLGDANKFQWDYDRYTNTTVESVMEFARKYLSEHRAVTVIVPEGALGNKGETIDKNTQEAAPLATVMTEPEDTYANVMLPESTVDRDNLPESGPESMFTPPAIQEGKLKNGARLLVVEDHRFPLIQTDLVLMSGWSADPQGKFGTAAMTAALLDEGTKSHDALQISDAELSIGADFSTGSSFDKTQVSLNVLKSKFDEGLELMSDVVINPTFPEMELARLRKEYLGRIESENRQPLRTSLKKAGTLLFGSDNPYGQPYTGSGTEATINALTRKDLVDFYKSNYKPNNATFVVVGDITLNDARSYLDKAFAKWKKGKVKTLAVAKATPPEATTIYLIDKPGAAQSAIAIMNLAFPSNSADAVTADVMNNALGGKFMSRINLNLREDKAYTYGAHSTFRELRNTGAFIAYSEVQTEVTDSALYEFFKEFRDARGDRPIVGDELVYAKDNSIKGFPKNFTNITTTANTLADLVAEGVSLDDWQTYVNRVNNVNEENVKQMVQKYVTPGHMVVVVVGDKEKVEQGLKDLTLGEVKLIEP
ncbi:MAG: pitrilysin family protein [bacterium]